MIRSLGDIKKEEQKTRKANDYYAGGEKSGLAVSDPEVESIVQKAKDHVSSVEQRENEIDIAVTLYANGFTVDDGPLRDYKSPDGAQFMAELNQNRVPRELHSRTQGRPVGIKLSDRREEEFIPPPPPKYVAFGGEGQSLNSSSSVAGAPVNTQADGPAYDPSQPTASVQIRFHTGQRKTVTVNLSTRVVALYEYVMVAAPVNGSFELIAGFPPRALENPQLSIEEAGLAGAAVTQRLV